MTSMDFDELSESLAVIFSSTAILGVCIMIFAIVGIFLLAVYILSCIGLYRMAKKLGHDKPWLAWIPFANTWLMFTLPRNEYRVLALNKVIPDRTNAFWIHIAIQYGADIAIAILACIPIVNYVVTAISPFMGIATTVAFIFMMFPVYKDLYSLFLPEETAKNYAVASVICAFVAPIVNSILFIIVSGKEPIEGSSVYVENTMYGN